MKIYSKKHLILGLIYLGLVLFWMWLWNERGERDESIYMILFHIPVCFFFFRNALSKKHARAALIAENDELEKLKWLKLNRFSFWFCIYCLLVLSCWTEANQPVVAYGFLAAAALLLLLRWGFTLFYSFRLSKER